MQTYIINNLTSKQAEIALSEETLAAEITSLMKENMRIANENIYSKEEMENLYKNKTIESVTALMCQAYLVYVLDEEKQLVACGMLVKKDERYFIKTLHTHSKCRGKGYGQMICKLCEEFAKELGVEVIYIETLKYPKTLAFYQKQGFIKCNPYKQLKYTYLMKKNLQATCD